MPAHFLPTHGADAQKKKATAANFFSLDAMNFSNDNLSYV